jgi:ribosome-binding factor A
MKTARQEKIAEEIRREVSTIIHFELQDPRIQGITVTGVKMTPDLRVARVYFTIPGEPERGWAALKGLKSSSGLIKRLISQRVLLKFMPNFEFFYDESLELQERIDTLFLEIEAKKNSNEG